MKNAFTVYGSDDKPEYLSTEKWKELLAKKQGPILYSAALIKTRKKYESDIADLREEYGIDRIKEKYQKEAK